MASVLDAVLVECSMSSELVWYIGLVTSDFDRTIAGPQLYWASTSRWSIILLHVCSTQILWTSRKQEDGRGGGGEGYTYSILIPPWTGSESRDHLRILYGDSSMIFGYRKDSRLTFDTKEFPIGRIYRTGTSMVKSSSWRVLFDDARKPSLVYG